MKYNKLIPRQWREGLHPKPFDESRCSGRTTAIALRVISLALASPGKRVYAVDHHLPGGHYPTRELKRVIEDLAAKLDLKYIEVRLERMPLHHYPDDAGYRVSAVCNLYTDNPWEIA